MIQCDHIEVHVKNAKKYGAFLVQLMGNGRYQRISDNETYMFVSADQIHIEIKQKDEYVLPFDTKSGIGFCMPCLRMKGAFDHLMKLEGLEIKSEIQNPDGACYFFRDYEGIDWHFKDYDIQDKYINI
jgi:hypothetical protein